MMNHSPHNRLGPLSIGLDGANTLSTHRAFIYSASAPGAGHIYAGFRLPGFIILSLFIGISGWLIWILTTWLATAVEALFGQINTMGKPAAARMPIVSLGAAFLVLFLIWYGALLSAVDLTVRQRQRHGSPPQASVAWALAMSWLCPGTGQVYTGQRSSGLVVFLVYISAMLMMVSAYRNLFHGLSGVVFAGQPGTGSIEEIVRQVHILLRKVDFSTGRLLQHAVKWYAIANALEILRQGPLRSDTRWLIRSPRYGLALLGIGWLCPGAGQLLQGRHRAGWLFWAGYLASTITVGLAAGRGVISIPAADHLEWLSIIIQWAAALEALLSMKRPSGPIVGARP